MLPFTERASAWREERDAMQRSPVNRWHRRSVPAIAAIVALSVVAVGGFPGIAVAAPGSLLWAKRFGASDTYDSATSVVVSPDGSRLFVTGTSDSRSATVAYDPTTGVKLWAKTYSGSGLGAGSNAIEVSPDSTRVFVTGQSYPATGSSDYATVSYDASTGAQLWAKRYNGTGNMEDSALAIAVSPDGSQVFVTGESYGGTTSSDYATVAYEAATGNKQWVRRYNDTVNGGDSATAVNVAPDGSLVFVTGLITGSTSAYDYTTVAYMASTGKTLWTKRYDGPGGGWDQAHALGVSPDGSTVFVAGYSEGVTLEGDFATLAYDASTGDRLWTKRYNGPEDGGDGVDALGVSPDGSQVFVTGPSFQSSGYDYATVGYDASTGAQMWATRYNGPGDWYDYPRALKVSPDGSQVFVTGYSIGSTSDEDYATLAYDASTGAKLWLRRYNGPGDGVDEATALDVTPDGSEVVVTGSSAGSTGPYDYATLAYDAA
jgi:hypothetical protein